MPKDPQQQGRDSMANPNQQQQDKDKDKDRNIQQEPGHGQARDPQGGKQQNWERGQGGQQGGQGSKQGELGGSQDDMSQSGNPQRRNP